jgi:chemotaxis-related protein WspB
MLVLMCAASGNRYALDARHVVEVVPRVRLECVAGSPDWLAGVCVYRGQVTPILDLTYLATAKCCPSRWANRIIVVPIDEGDSRLLCGLIVEQVTVAQLASIPESRATSPALGGAPWGPVLLDADGLFQLLELPRLLSHERRAALMAHVLGHT